MIIGPSIPYPQPDGPWFFTFTRAGGGGSGMCADLDGMLSTIHYELAFWPDTVVAVSRHRREPHIWTPEHDPNRPAAHAAPGHAGRPDRP